MNIQLREKSAEWQEAIKEAAEKMVTEFLEESSIDEIIAKVLLNDDYTERTGSDWDSYFRKEFGLKALFCACEARKLPPTWRDAFELAEEVYKKLPSGNDYGKRISDKIIDKKKYTFAQRGEVAFIDNYSVLPGTVIRVDVVTNEDAGTLVYWNKGFKKTAGGFGNDSAGQLAKIFVLNCIPEVEDEKLDGFAPGTIKAVSLICKD